MPSLLGKRKSRATDDDAVDAQEALRKLLEARFAPLGVAPAPPETKSTAASSDEESGEDDEDYDNDTITDVSDSDDGWDGVSDEDDEEDEENEEEEHTVEIVDHTSFRPSTTSLMSKKELKTYLSSRPPTAAAAQPTTTKSKKKQSDGDDQAEDSAAFLANDLALQRLIAESHILSAAGGNTSHWQSSAAANSAANTRAFAAGRTAKKTTDLRIQALGAKGSVLDQAKMPMAMRKGIVSAGAAKEAKRRQEAKENGIILERAMKKAKTVKKKGRGERSVDAPGVGRMKGAQLTISAREARALSGGGQKGGRGGRGGRRW